MLYSISDPAELVKALRKFATRESLDADATADAFRRTPPFQRDYGSYSEKAVKKLLPLMRYGKYWSTGQLDAATRERITEWLAGGEMKLPERAAAAIRTLRSENDYQGLPVWLACYIVYGRHSEVTDTERWTSPDDIDTFLRGWRQHCLHNPIVETVVLETLRVVRDIWRQVGHIDEIHIEMGRELKLSAREREERTRTIFENERTNQRIKALLNELTHPEMGVEGVRPYSPSQQTILRIYEEAALGGAGELPDDIRETAKKLSESDARKRPSHADIVRYKCWLEQQYCSPYTGASIPLARLFTSDYQIEHIIPRARYFDDSLSNKVICEAAVNQRKGALLGYEFICQHGGEVVDLGKGRTVEISTKEAYEAFVNEHYRGSRSLLAKRKKLLMADIPEDFIQRQLNDTRYIAKLVKALLSRIVRQEGETEATSRRVITCVGQVTDRLKRDWGLKDVWNRIILPRFERMNRKDGSTAFTTRNTEGHTIPSMPLDKQMGFNYKRIDHRHHAMDAIAIACASRNIVNYLNNASACKNAEISRTDLQKLLCYKTRPDSMGHYKWVLRKPWETFTQNAYAVLQGIVVSFKQNLRILSKTKNAYWHYDATGKKVRAMQEKGDHLAIRKPLHKDTFYGDVNLRRKKPYRCARPWSSPNASWNVTCGGSCRNSSSKATARKPLNNILPRTKTLGRTST